MKKRRYFSESGVEVLPSVWRMARAFRESMAAVDRSDEDPVAQLKKDLAQLDEALTAPAGAALTRRGARRVAQARLVDFGATDASKNIARISEKTPPGFEDVVRALKKKPNVDNPYAIAWSMYNEGYSAQAAIRLVEDDDVPIDAVKSDLRRKQSLRQVMGKPQQNVTEGLLDDLLDDCSDEEKDAEGRCPHDPDYEGPVDADEAGRDPRKAMKSLGTEPSEAEHAFANEMAKQEGADAKERKEDVNYRYSASDTVNCGNCRFFIEPGSCRIVEGLIRTIDVCDRFEASKAKAATEAFKESYQQ